MAGAFDMKEEFKQEKPEWCPHSDCAFRRRVQDSICGGVLPEPESHGEDYNTHRICIKTDSVFDLQVNNTDLEWFRWVFDSLDGKTTSWLSKRKGKKYGI